MSMPPPGSPPAYGPPGTAPMYGAPAKPQTMMPMIGGIMLIVAGILSIANWGYILAFFATDPTVAGFMGMVPGLATLVFVCGAIFIVLSIITLLGGVMAMRRKMWGLALVGSILGLFTIGFFGISSLLSFIALIVLIIARKEF